MSEQVHTTSDSLCKLVHWAHSHGTICSLIPSLQHLTCSSYVLTPQVTSPRGVATVAVWGCSAGHAYHWPFLDHDNGPGGSVNPSQGQVRLAAERPSKKVTVRPCRAPSCSEAASEAEEFSSSLFDNGGCDSSATDDDADYDYEPPRSLKRVRPSGGGAAPGKKVKQEVSSAVEVEAVVASNADSLRTQPPDTETEPMDAGGYSTENVEGTGSATDATEETAGGENDLTRLQELLRAERSRTQQMTNIISGLSQDKELLQQELSKKAELIWEFLQDQLRLDRTRPLRSSQTKAGSSRGMTSVDNAAAFESQFDAFDETQPLEHPLTPKSKRNREGENTRVRMKNMSGVIARYMTALQAFRCSVSMKVAFDRVGVDRNTISRTAAIAELSIAAPEVFHALAPWDEKEETLAHYAHRCKQAMDDNIKAKIKSMKAKGELLPIVSK